LPRGLGEDPLVRQKKVRRRSSAQSTVLAPAPVSSGDTSSPQDSAQVGTLVDVSSSPASSYNDVFFRKRSESSTVVVSADSGHDAAVPSAPNFAVAQPLIAETAAAEPVFAEPVADIPVMTAPAVETPVASVFIPVPDAAETFTSVPDTPSIEQEAHVSETFAPTNVSETFAPTNVSETFAPTNVSETFATPVGAETFISASDTSLTQDTRVTEPSAPATDATVSAPVIQPATQVSETEPQKKGFFKRVFGRFQK
jgi:hypothetical protein